MSSRCFTDAEIALARELRSQGRKWHQIARALGRRSGVGIRRRLDPDYRDLRNAYNTSRAPKRPA